MVRSKRAMGLLWAILGLAAHVSSGVVSPLQAQSSRKDDIVFNSRGVPLAGATVRVCAMPASNQPCTPLALIYSDAALTQALANPTTTDGLGNYFFYAAPGKYEIEISGPGITTKQIPNVVLPSDPSNPTFTGAVSAFSLNLSGNLTVNGNTSIVGNLASGTLNLANQGAAPGAAGAGTVNLYTKSADKRLYYKDDSGIEIGPIAASSGAQTNVVNTFTAAQNFDSDFHNKGPNPWADVSRFGGYFGPATPPSTTGSITSGTAALALGNAQDFVNGNGVLVLGAGAAPTLATRTGLTVAPGGVTGATTYNYCVVAEDYFGGRTACSTAAAVTTSVATIGVQTVALSGCNRAAGIVTCTTTGNHNFLAGYQVNVTGTNSNYFEGTYTIVTVPTATTFTYNQYGFKDSTGILTSGNAQVVGYNRLRWNSDSSNAVLRSYIYRCAASCGVVGPNYALAGVAIGVDGYFEDRGFAVGSSTIGNGDVPATAPTSASNQWLSTTINSGGGTTSLTLAANAVSTVVGATVLHDNSPNVINACSSFNTKGGTVYIPNSNIAANYFPINSTLNLRNCPYPQTQLQFANKIWQNGTIIPAGFGNIKGLPSADDASQAPFYHLRPLAVVFGYAYPFIYATSAGSYGNNQSYDDLFFVCNQSYQPCYYQDQATAGGSIAGGRFTNVHFYDTTGRSTPLVMKGGFGFMFEYGGWADQSNNFSTPPAALFSVNCGLGNSGQQFSYIVNTQYTYIFGGVVFENCGQTAVVSSQLSVYSFRDTLIESSYVPLIRLSNQSGVQGAPGIAYWEMERQNYGDQLGGFATPLIDAAYGTIRSIKVHGAGCANGDPLFSTSTSAQGIEVSDNSGCSALGMGTPNYVQRQTDSPFVYSDLYANYQITANGAKGGFIYQMATPNPAQSAVVSAGGSVPVGAHTYAIQAFDYSGNGTVASTSISATTTSGNQTVAVTLPAAFPAGAKGVEILRDGNVVNNGTCPGTPPRFTTPGAVFNDTASGTCGNAVPIFTNAGASIMDANGLATAQLRLNSEALTASPRAEQNVFLPGAFTSTWTASSWTLDKAVTITRLQVQAKTVPAGCTTNAVVRLTDGTTPVGVTVTAAANDSGAIAQNYPAGATLTIAVQTAAAGCTTAPADGNVVAQYKMQ